jgi:hypothetical protein
MKEPPPVTEIVQRQMRYCVWSVLTADTLTPGYRCNYNWRHKGKWCNLYRSGCGKRNQFPKCHNT